MPADFIHPFLKPCRLLDNENYAGAPLHQNYDAGMRLPIIRKVSRIGLAAITAITFILQPGSVRAQLARAGGQEVEDFITAIQMHDDTNALAMLEADTNLAFANENFSKLPLLEAAAAGNVPLMKKLIELGADINAAGDTRMSAGSQKTALHWAIYQNQPEACKFLLAAGADPNRMAFGFETPLHLAFSKGQEEMAGWLLDYGAHPFQGKLYSGESDNITPFELDITASSGRMVPRMLGQDPQHPLGAKSLQKPRHSHLPPRGMKTAADVLAQHGSALLQAAATRGELEAVEALFKAGVTVSNAVDGLTLMQAFAQAMVSAQNSRPGVEQRLHQVQDQLNQDYIAHADKNFVDSLHSQEKSLEEQLASLAPDRWQGLLILLVNQRAGYDALSATALDDTNQVARLLSANKNVAYSHDFAGNTPLHWAVRNDRLPLVSFWIQAGTPLDATNTAGKTALHLAAVDGKTEYVKTLLAANAPTEIRDTNGLTPLDVAIQAKQTDVIHVLMADKSAPAHPERGFTITMHKSAENGDVAALAALVETETNLEARNELGLTPLQVAVTHGHLAAAALLVDKGADINVRDPDGNTLLHQIFLQNQFLVYDRPPPNWLAGLKDSPHKDEFVKYLTVGQNEQGPNWILQGTSFLLACGVDAQATNHAGQTVMQLVTDGKTGCGVFFFDGDRYKLFKLLTGAGGNVEQRDADGNTALHRLGTGFYDSTKTERMASLIDSGADIDATNNLGQTPLFLAATNIMGWDGNNPPVNEPFQLLVYKKANVNAQDLEGRTPLHVVAASGTSFKKEAMRLLLDSGANPNLRDKPGRTPVHYLLMAKWPWEGAGDGIDMLAAAGADLSAKDNEGRTPLHYLASLGSEKPMFFIRGIGDTFIIAKVDINARDNDGNTPLHLAGKSGTHDVFDWLVEHGADLDATNHAGETPRQLAAQNPNPFSHFDLDANVDIFNAIRQGKLEAVASILKSTPSFLNQINEFKQTPLLVAAQMHRTNIVDFLDHQGARWDPTSAIMAGRTETLRRLIAQQPGLAADVSLLRLAAGRGNLSAAEILLAAGADVKAVDGFGLSAVGDARAAKHDDMVDLLVKHGAVENIFDAVFTGDTNLAVKLVEGDKSLAFATNGAGFCVAEIAATTGQETILKLLLKKGVSVNFQNARSGQSLLCTAVAYNQTNTVELLLEHGAKMDDYGFNGYAPIHVAALNGSVGALELLLKNKADVDLRTHDTKIPEPGFVMASDERMFMAAGNTPLHVAAMTSQTNTIALLLKWKASVNALDDGHLTPLDLAERSRPMLPFSKMPFVPGFSPGPTGIMAHRSDAIALLKQAGGKDRKELEPAGATSPVSPPRPLPALANGSEYHGRGCNDFNSQDFTNALADFRKSAELGSDNQDYTYYRIWIIRSTMGEGGSGDR
jgi:ankyrin repeat protein